MVKSRSMLGCAVLGVAAFSAAGALAQTQDHNGPDRSRSGPQYSTPAEQAQTDQLNRAGQQGYTAPPSLLNGPQRGGIEAAQRTSQERDRQYSQSQARYGAQMEHYRDQREEYRRQKMNYRAAMARYDRREWRFDNYPQPVSMSFASADLRDVALIRDPRARLDRAPVEGPDGNWLGKIRSVTVGMGGRAREAEIALNRQFAVWVPARHLRYDAGAGVVLTDLSRNDLWGMPGVYVQTADYSGYAD